jgi:hypothetical protein
MGVYGAELEKAEGRQTLSALDDVIGFDGEWQVFITARASQRGSSPE